MPVMSAVERAFCRSGPWRSFTRRVVVPWALDGVNLDGQVLELGSGSGTVAEQLLARFPSIRLTATDVDSSMLDTARQRLASFGDRVEVQQADATQLPFPNGCFDAVVSFIMLHHTVQWEKALSEAVRVLRPGGHLAGYDLVESGSARVLHRFDLSPHRLATIHGVRERLGQLPVEDVRIEPALRGLIVRFQARRSDDATEREPTAEHQQTP
jgi:ubiquinone/menaquinone biosynthesis C-methylase UbiE